MMTPIGVFLCTCDGKITKRVDAGAVAETLRRNLQVETAVVPHACLPDGIHDLKQVVREKGFERVVVAACPARFQQKHLSDACAQAGVEADYFALVDWREGCAWAHRGDQVGATEKGSELVEMGIGRVTNATRHEKARTRIVPRVLVIGGGIAGMTAARRLAERGIAVTLVERDAELGGQLRGVNLNGATSMFESTRRTVSAHPLIALYTNAVVSAITGETGKYSVEIKYPTGKTLMHVGAIVIATGAYELREPHLFHYDGRRVVTLQEFEIRNYKLEITNSLVYILCAGSRDERIPYCSNVCCLGSLHQAVRVKREHPQTQVTILFRDLYLMGDEWNDRVVLEARQLGIEFIRYAPGEPPRVAEDAVVVRDTLTGMTRQIEYDRVVLATPQVPQNDTGVLARWLHLPRDPNGFLIDPHYRVRPEQQLERGIFICGAAHQPVGVDTAILQGMTAAARATRFIQQGILEHPAASAQVDLKLCTGCAQCVETCAFGAITLTPTPLPLGEGRLAHILPSPYRRGVGGEGVLGGEVLDRAHIDPFLCLACGNCVVACPAKAISLPNSNDAQILAQIDAALGICDGNGQRDAAAGSRVLVFGCAWSGYAAMELAGARRMNYSVQVRAIELPCSARLDPMHVLYALLNGAARVVLALCPPNECHYGNGNRWAEMRIENLRAQLSAHGMDPQRVNYARLTGDDAQAWIKAMEEVRVA